MKLPFWGTILTILGLMVLCALGAWQIQRLQWKQGILSAIDREERIEASAVPLTPNDLGEDDYFRRGYISGHYDHQKTIRVFNRTFDGVPGYHLYTVFYLDTPHASSLGNVMLVNRGWFPLSDDEVSQNDIFIPHRIVKIVGTLRRPASKNAFTPENVVQKNRWFFVDLDEVMEHFALQGLAPNVFYAQDEVPVAEGFNRDAQTYPVYVDGSVRPNNNHAQYAFFWFAMAFAMAGVYFVRFIKPQIGIDKK